MPTKRAFFILFFSVILLVGAWGSKLLWLYFAFSVCISLLLLSYLLSFYLVANLDIKRYMPERVYEDEHFSVTIKLRSRMFILDQSIEIEDTFSAADAAHQPKKMYINGLLKGSMQFSYPEICYKRGKYKIGPFRIKIFEPFGLFYAEREIPVYSTLTVYPRIFHVNRLPFILGHLAPRFGEQTTRISGEYEEFYGIREYQQEDGWRRIHWPSTARLQELMVRHFEQSSQWKAVLVLDVQNSANVGYGRDTTFEYSIKILASLAKHLVHKNASFGLIASASEAVHVQINKGLDHYHKILSELAVINSDSTMPVHELISRYKWAIPASSSLIIATNSFSPQLVKILKIMKIQMNVGIIPVIMNAPSFLVDRKQVEFKDAKMLAAKKTLNKLSSEVYFVNCKDDLKLHFVK